MAQTPAAAPEAGSGPTEWGCRLLKVRAETPTVTTFSFELPESPFSFRPGQYVVLRQAGLSDPRGDSRTFSISSAPSDRDALTITTRAGPSPFKRQLFASAPGSRFGLWGPFGTFTIDPARPSVLLGGGIGVTPFRSMIHEEAAKRSHVPMVLLYSGRTVEEMVYRSELEEVARAWSDFHLVLSVTRPEESRATWSGATGHFDAKMVDAATRGLKEPLYYICGAPSMVVGLNRMLMAEKGVPAEDIRTELFRGY